MGWTEDKIIDSIYMRSSQMSEKYYVIALIMANLKFSLYERMC